MEYIYNKTKENYEHLSSGKVIFSTHGTTSFPVRLASEIVQRCFGILRKKGLEEPYILYDPCCGGGYLITVIGFLHGNCIRKIIASDIDEKMIGITERNLSLLFHDGIIKRKSHLKELVEMYKKPSHVNAINSAAYLMILLDSSNLKEVSFFHMDCTAIAPNEERCKNANIIITDLPYGEIVKWNSKSANPIVSFFENIINIADRDTCVLAIVADKNQKLIHKDFRRLQYGKIGKRHFGIFEPMG